MENEGGGSPLHPALGLPGIAVLFARQSTVSVQQCALTRFGKAKLTYKITKAIRLANRLTEKSYTKEEGLFRCGLSRNGQRTGTDA